MPQKVRHRITMWPSNSALRYIPQRIENAYFQLILKYLDIKIYSNTIHNSQTKCSLTDEEINEL